MRQQLSRTEIVALLLQHGFVRDGEPQVHAEGWARRDERIYLKTGERFPLVIDPRHEIWLATLLSAPGVVGSPERYAHNSNFTGFDRRMHAGKTSIAYGLDFGFQSAAALEAFLGTLSGKPVALPSAEADIETATDLPERETERQAVIAARRGQGLFRELLDRRWGNCAVTACATRSTAARLAHSPVARVQQRRPAQSGQRPAAGGPSRRGLRPGVDQLRR